MKEYILNYYSIFKCIAGECKHTCCAGWKMYIDEQSLNAYRNENSSFCGAIKKGINFKKSCFNTDKKGRCAFLNQKGLCEIIINLGEQGLCQVCRDHPRFRSFFDDRAEMGLGFCCEQATKVILSFKEKIQPVMVGDDGEQIELDFNQKNILEFRKKVLQVIQDRNIDINKRINSLLSLCNAHIELNDYSKIIKGFLSFERLDKNWTKRLKSINRNTFINGIDKSLTHYAEQFLVNSVYRHLSDAEDTIEVRARAVACVLGLWVVNSIFEQEQAGYADKFSLIADIVRAYSAEVEYSQKNLNRLFSLSYKLIKI